VFNVIKSAKICTKYALKHKETWNFSAVTNDPLESLHSEAYTSFRNTRNVKISHGFSLSDTISGCSNLVVIADQFASSSLAEACASNFSVSN
jgi:hypothetical protein